MICRECVYWRCEPLTYGELKKRWHEALGGDITPGHLRRYRKEAEKSGLAVEQVRISYKYCAAGKLSRFYLMKGAKDIKLPFSMDSCPHFSAGPKESFATIWRICSEETHGPSHYRGVHFVPGLYENKSYTRVPMYGSLRPLVERSSERCAACGGQAQRVLVVELRKVFCCNEHYIAWWAQRYREEYSTLLK